MSVPTTLITFLVRVPPTTRSVSIYGSWDNFSTGYSMQRDSRLGPEHWSGCHSFHNIIFDGIAGNVGMGRDGGLKMGGTYWYYYKLDDDIEFHNSAESATTSCPLLPGQLVNVLHVPFNLASGRPRNASTSSAVSEHRTMNPQDKYINPRPVPKLPRLNTSPTLPTFAGSSSSTPASGTPWTARPTISSRDTSPPTSSSSMKRFRLPRKASNIGKVSRSISPGRDRGPSGIKAAIRNIVAPRNASPESESRRGRSEETTPVAEISGPVLVRRKENSQSPRPYTRRGEQPSRGPRSASSDLRLRRPLDNPAETADESFSSMTSFSQHRRQRSRSRDPSPLRQSLTLEDGQRLRDAVFEVVRPNNGGLEAVVEVNTPQWPTTAKKTPSHGMHLMSNLDSPSRRGHDDGGIHVLGQPLVHGGNVEIMIEADPDTEKRLPTLPNTPSSAYPVSEIEDSPMRLPPQQAPLEEISHFSSTTIDSTASRQIPIPPPPISLFSSWTTSAGQSNRAISDSSYERVKSSLTEFETSPTFSYPDEGSTKYMSQQNWQHYNGITPTANASATAMLPYSLPNSDSLASTMSHASFATSIDDISPIAERFNTIGLNHEDHRGRHFAHTRSALQTPPVLDHQQTYQLPFATNETRKQHEESTRTTTADSDHQSRPTYHIRSDSKDWQKNYGGLSVETNSSHRPNVLLPHSESMRQLLEEIGYLKGIIAGHED